MVQIIVAVAIVYGAGYVVGALLVDPIHDRTSLSMGVVRLLAGLMLAAIAFLLSLELSIPWYVGPLGLVTLAVLRHRHAAWMPPVPRLSPTWSSVATGLMAVVLLAPPVISAARMAPGSFPPVYLNVDVPYFVEQVHALVDADTYPPGSLSVLGGRRSYHFGLHAIAALIARGSGIAPHHAVFLVLVPLLAAGILAASVGLVRALSPAVPLPLAVPLLLIPSPTLWYDFSQTVVRTIHDAAAEGSLDPFESLGVNWELWGVAPNIQNLAAHFIVLAGLGAVVSATAIGWRLTAFLLGSAIIFKSPAGIALVSGFCLAQACRAALMRSLRPLFPAAAVAVVFAVVYAIFWVLVPVRGELRIVVWPLFQLAYVSSHGGLRWFVADVAWLLLPALIVWAARRDDPERLSLPLLAFAVAPFMVVNVLMLEDLRRGFGISSMNQGDWRQIILPMPAVLHAFVVSMIARRWVNLSSAFRRAVIAAVVVSVVPSLAAAWTYSRVLLEHPVQGHEFADNGAIGAALAVIPTRDTIVVTNDLRYPADGFRRENLQMQIPSLFGHQAFAVNYMYEAYPFSDERKALQRLLEAAHWTPAIEEAARIHHWTHLLIHKDAPHPEPVPLERIYDSPLYSVFRFTTR